MKLRIKDMKMQVRFNPNEVKISDLEMKVTFIKSLPIILEGEDLIKDGKASLDVEIYNNGAVITPMSGELKYKELNRINIEGFSVHADKYSLKIIKESNEFHFDEASFFNYKPSC